MIQRLKTMAGAMLAALTLVALQGCSSKPPACGDSATVDVIHNMLVENASAVLQASAPGLGIEDDPKKIQDGYYAALKVSLSNVVSDGYNESAKKNSCRAQLAVRTPSGEQLSRDIMYSTQKTEDKSSGFVVEVRDFNPFVISLVTDLVQHYAAKRYAGEWKGTYECGGIGGATEGPQGPFSMPVAMVTDEQLHAKLERTTKGGGIEILKGEAGHHVRLQGEGRNSPDDTWRTEFEGDVQGLAFSAAGRIVASDGQVLRQCTLKLSLPSS